MKPGKKSGFTLVEVLVALGILGVIVVLCGRIFEQANISWTTGSRKAEVNMIGRGIADFIAQDVARCVARVKTDADLSGNNPSFKIIDEASVPPGSASTKSLVDISYSLGSAPLTRTVKTATETTTAILLPSLKNDMMLNVSAELYHPLIATNEVLPAYVDVEVTAEDTDTNYKYIFQSRAWLANRDRYKYDE
jgi:prepilin-type N-terminal cleavage/methylation domain-containing protein